MSSSNVIAQFDHPSAAQDALTALVEAGFARESIAVVASASEDVLRRQRLTSPHETDRALVAPELGAAIGLVLGGGGGSFAGLLLGAGWLNVMGKEAAMAVGPFWAAAIGAVVMGTAGAIAGYLFNAGLPKLEPAQLEHHGPRPRPSLILSVATSTDRAAQASNVVERFSPLSVKVWRLDGESWIPAGT